VYSGAAHRQTVLATSRYRSTDRQHPSRDVLWRKRRGIVGYDTAANDAVDHLLRLTNLGRTPPGATRANQDGIVSWISAWNDDPKPFRWTKTAEEILDSLAKYIARISGAAH
jgi:hypothetical protein